MDELTRELLAEEQGVTWCVVTDSYTSCDGYCDSCLVYLDFIEILKLN